MYCLVATIVNFLIGTAWLSSARVVECSIHLLNERNLRRKYKIDYLLKKHVDACLTKNYLVYDFMTKLIIKIFHVYVDSGTHLARKIL